MLAIRLLVITVLAALVSSAIVNNKVAEKPSPVELSRINEPLVHDAWFLHAEPKTTTVQTSPSPVEPAKLKPTASVGPTQRPSAVTTAKHPREASRCVTPFLCCPAEYYCCSRQRCCDGPHFYSKSIGPQLYCPF